MCYERILDAFTSTSFKYKNQEVLTWRHFSFELLYASLFVFLDVTRHKPSIKLLVHQLRKLLPRLFFLERGKHPGPRFDVSASRNISDAAIQQFSFRVLQSPFCWVNSEENPGGAITRIFHLQNWVCSQHSTVVQRLFLLIRSALSLPKRQNHSSSETTLSCRRNVLLDSFASVWTTF